MMRFAAKERPETRSIEFCAGFLLCRLLRREPANDVYVYLSS
jgi:hypothetical protein